MARNKKKGFTLVEALLASIILAAAAIAISAISVRCLSRTSFNQEYEQAWAAMDRQLVSIETAGIDQFIEQGIMEGYVQGANEEESGKYRWQAEVENEAIGKLYRIKMTITWQEKNHLHQITAETLLNGQETGASVAQAGY